MLAREDRDDEVRAQGRASRPWDARAEMQRGAERVDASEYLRDMLHAVEVDPLRAHLLAALEYYALPGVASTRWTPSPTA